MKFYIASKLSSYKKVQQLSILLRELGWVHTYDWTALDIGNEIDVETLKNIASREADGVRNAEVLIVLTPEGRGTHVELGMAIALGKTIYIHHTDDKYFLCGDDTCAFYWLPNVKHFVGTIDDLAKYILSNNQIT